MSNQGDCLFKFHHMNCPTGLLLTDADTVVCYQFRSVELSCVTVTTLMHSCVNEKEPKHRPSTTNFLRMLIPLKFRKFLLILYVVVTYSRTMPLSAIDCGGLSNLLNT